MVGSSLGVLCATWWWRGKPAWRLDWEKLFVAWSALLFCTMPYVNPWYVATAWGSDPEQTWGYDTRDSGLLTLIFLDCGITMVCIFVPFRVCVSWILVVSSILSYIYMVLLWSSPFPSNDSTTILTLSLLCSFSFAGAWRHELHLREKWSAEHKLTATRRQVEE